MIKLKFKKIIKVLKNYPWKETAFSLRFLPKTLTRLEKVILLGFFILAVFSGVMIGYKHWLGNTKVTPETGGVFREGLVGETKDFDKHLSRLINAGLTKYDKEKNIVPDLAEKWEINENGKVYVFHLRPQFNSEELASQIVSRGIWKEIEISTPDPATITFTFKQPFSPFLYDSTESIFPYGPYRISKETKSEIELSPREDYYAGRPYIDKIVIRLYKDQNELLKAAKRGEVEAFSLLTDSPTLKNFQKLEMKLPRELVIFFNLSKEPLKDLNVRQALKEGASPGKALELRLVTSDNQKNVELARQIADKWEKSGVKVNLDIKDNVSLQKTIIPKRDYDVLLYGFDYGEDPDPYPFWHSSQIKEDGRNLSNFKNAKGDKLLEEARQEFDFQKREEKYAEFQKILEAEIPAFTVEKETLYFQISKEILGVEKIVGAFESDRFLNVSEWYIETKRVKK